MSEFVAYISGCICGLIIGMVIAHGAVSGNTRYYEEKIRNIDKSGKVKL